jgi:(5-formylfuran-3-yl)methyl phosphate synthase
MTALLASVRTVAEASAAMENGADIIDLKDPTQGALGALPRAVIEAIVERVRATGAFPVSATVGDLDDGEHDEMVRRVLATAQTGVDFVKVGIAPGAGARGALRRLAGLPVRVVPLFLADAGLDLALIDVACAAGFPIVMVDTGDKRTGSLFDCVAPAVLAAMIRITHDAGARAGLAGSLRFAHVPMIAELAPDIAGFRGALCDGTRTGTLLGTKVRALRDALPQSLRLTPVS